MTELNLIAAPTSDDQSTSGIMVFWTVAGGACSHDELTEQLQVSKAVATDNLPKLPSAPIAFHRALQEFEGPSRFLRARKGRNSGFYIVDEDQDDEKLELATNLLLQLKEGTVVAEGRDPEDLASQVQKEFEVQSLRMTGRDVSLWLVDRVKSLDAVPLRPSGGMYFIPRAQMGVWRIIATCIEESTEYRVFEIPVLHTEEAIESILAAVLREAKTESVQIAEDIRSSNLGVRALRKRATRAEELALKIERYENLLDREIGEYRSAFQLLAGASVRAALRVEAANTESRGVPHV